MRVHFKSCGEHHIVEVEQDIMDFLDDPNAFDTMKGTIEDLLEMPVDGAVMVEVD